MHRLVISASTLESSIATERRRHCFGREKGSGSRIEGPVLASSAQCGLSGVEVLITKR